MPTLSVSYERQEYGVDCLSFEPAVFMSEMNLRVSEHLDMQNVPFEMMPKEEAVESCLTVQGKGDTHLARWKKNVYKFIMSIIASCMVLPHISKAM